MNMNRPVKVTFNPKKNKNITRKEILTNACRIKDKETADKYLADYVKHLMKTKKMTQRAAEVNAKADIYCFAAASQGTLTAKRMQELFYCDQEVVQ